MAAVSQTAGVEPEGVRVLLPPSYDVLWSVLALACSGLLTWALVLWFRARPDRGGGVLDLLVVLFVPVIGPAAYLLAHYRAHRRHRSRATSPVGGPTI